MELRDWCKIRRVDAADFAVDKVRKSAIREPIITGEKNVPSLAFYGSSLWAKMHFTQLAPYFQISLNFFQGQ